MIAHVITLLISLTAAADYTSEDCPVTNTTCCGLGEGRPSLFILGAVKAGTTAIHHNLRNVFPMPPGIAKELFFFNDDEKQSKVDSLRAYAAHLGAPGCLGQKSREKRQSRTVRVVGSTVIDPSVTTGGPLLVVDGTPLYLPNALALSRVASAAPWASWVVMVREPVDRAYSHFNMLRRFAALPAFRGGRSRSGRRQLLSKRPLR